MKQSMFLKCHVKGRTGSKRGSRETNEEATVPGQEGTWWPGLTGGRGEGEMGVNSRPCQRYPGWTR